MWLWIIIIAILIGAVIGIFSSNGKNPKSDAASGAFAGGCLAMSCLVKLAIAALSIIFILWLFKVIFC